MQSLTPTTTTTRSLERFLAFVGTAICLVICVRIWQVLGGSQPMWPLPGFYLLEMVVVSGIGLFGLLGDESEHSSRVATLPWAAIGILAAFVVMGAWSIGLLFLPVSLIFAIAAVMANRRHCRNWVGLVGVGLLGAVAQVAIMLAVIRLLYPDAVY